MAMRPASLDLSNLFNSKNPRMIELSLAMLRAYVIGLSLANYFFLKAFPNTPPLYGSGVYYKPEYGTENWLPIPGVIAQGFGDCEDLASWRTAEYWVKGIFVIPDVRARLVSGVWRAHAFVRLPNRTIDDPSIRLGMKGID